ncbi:MAG: bifunctional indole-3-glycerol phosphate synthase/phosphoribosylanthranilate isomerase [Acidimicrobiales bacterium]
MRFARALAEPGLSFIAEVKRRSPSAGALRPNADPAALATEFAAAGARAISILVDDRFGGSLSDLRAARASTDVPLLAKGFFSTAAHLAEARDAGADAALLLLRDLDDDRAVELLEYAGRLGMDALVEAHDAKELARASGLKAPVIGINARDLATFVIDRRAQLELVRHAPKDRVIVAESGIETRAQAAAAELAGADAVLVGSTLMRSEDPGEKLRELSSRPLVKVCGLTRQEDVDAAVDAGVDFVGFVFANGSPRRAPRLFDVPPTVLSVAVFVGEALPTGADLVQLYDDAPGAPRGRDAALLRDGEVVARVVDQPWNRSDPAHWDLAARLDGRVMLAGGLGPENVKQAIARVRPWAVDASSALESAPGIKDHARVRAFIEAARS